MEILISITFLNVLVFGPVAFVYLFSRSGKNPPERGFWRRQFQLESTSGQRTFDWLFGAVLPVVCVLADPLVFSGSRALMGNYKPFAYLLSFVSIMGLMAFLLWGRKLKWLNGFLSGFFALGGTISMVVGIFLFPFSLIGLFFLIGFLGFTPLLSGFVYWRNAVRAYKFAQPVLGKQFLLHSAVLSALFGFVVPFVINVKIQNNLKTIERGDVPMIQKKTNALWIAASILNPEGIKSAYYLEDSNQARKEALRNSYKKLSGKNLELGWD